VLSLLPNVDNIDTLMRDIQDQIPKTITLRTFQATLERDTINERTQIPKTITLRTFQPTAPVKGYDTYSFTIGFDSKFEDILNAIQKIERLKPLLVIKDLTLTNQKTQSPTLMSADFTLQVFVPKN
jgi:type IV pilus assembly protein PilO